jgi:hypothetical protein
MNSNSTTSTNVISNNAINNTSSVTAPTIGKKRRSIGKRGAIVALAALACLMSVAAHLETSNTSADASATSSTSGRAKPRAKKTTRTQKRKPAKVTVHTKHKPKPKPLPTTFQDGTDGQDGQDGADGQPGADAFDGCEYDEDQDVYWCDEDTTEANTTDQADEPETTTTTLGVYKINGNEVDTSGASPATAKAATTAWKRFAKLIPQERRTMISTFSLIDKSETEFDGQVEEVDPKNHRWELRLKPGKDADDFVMVHEFGHLLTLSPQQLDANVSKKKCPPYGFWEGCPRPGSFTERFVQQFWTADLVRQAEQNNVKLDKRNPGWFVRDYSATNPGEDLADTFAEFVANRNQPTGNRIVDQKINMFYADPDMVWLRDQIRVHGRF